jgi:hypothetical protein
MKFNIRITKADGTDGGYLSHRNRMEWSFKTAVKHAEEFVYKHGGKATVVQA